MLYGAELIAALPLVVAKEQQPQLEAARPATPLSSKVVRILKGFVVTQKT
jgi:hypothetical protein